MRITRHQMFIDMCEVLARRSTCYRGNTGAIIVQNNDILSAGYNGPPSGEEHCKGNLCEIYPETGGCMRSEHAEKNAIGRAMGKTRKTYLSDCTLYSLAAPCRVCAERIKKVEIKTVIYRYPYRTADGIAELLVERHINLYRLTQSGYLINERTGQIEDA